MSLIDNQAYKQLEKSFGAFESTIIVAKRAKEISSSLGNRIPSATALDYAARGQLPNPKDYPDHRLDRAKNYVVYIEDIEVKSAIIASYEQSLYKNNLVYDYRTISDEPRQARVRIVMNILWDSRPHKNY